MNAIINISTVLYKSLCCASTKYEVQFCHARRSDGAGVSAWVFTLHALFLLLDFSRSFVLNLMHFCLFGPFLRWVVEHDSIATFYTTNSSAVFSLVLLFRQKTSSPKEVVGIHRYSPACFQSYISGGYKNHKRRNCFARYVIGLCPEGPSVRGGQTRIVGEMPHSPQQNWVQLQPTTTFED